VSIYSDAVLADGAVAYWRLGEPSGTVAADAAPVPHNGTISGGVTLAQTGAVVGNTAALFDGSTGQVVVPTFDPLAGLTRATFEAWVNHNGLAWSGTAEMLQYWGAGTHALYVLNGFAHVQLARGGNLGAFACTAAIVPTTGWHHLVGTWVSGLPGVMYRDGVPVTTTGATMAGTLNSAPGVKLCRDNLGFSQFKGVLDEVALYPTALTAAQVAYHYASSAAVFLPQYADVNDYVAET